LSDVAQAAIDAVASTMHAKEIRFRKNIDATASLVRGDRARLQQVIWILLSNAIKFTPRHGTIELHLERTEHHLELRVVDDGMGIKADFLPHIFEPFRQADASRTRKFGGMGLSLALVKQLIELHGGTVAVNSAGENKGSTFSVSLPIATFTKDHWPLVNRDLQSASLPVIPMSLEGLKVLIVDDESDARDLLRRVLGDCHARVFSAESAREGMEILRREMPDVLISDIGLPEMDGFQFIREIRALPAAQGGLIPALALTAYARSEDRAHAMTAGYQLHVVKPVIPQELIANVASLGKRSGA
jgi:CheY-like chemotaxis protein